MTDSISDIKPWSGMVGAVTCALVLMSGCDRPAQDLGANAQPESSFSDQVLLVREGRSNQIRLDHTLVRDSDLDSLAGLEPTLRRVNLSRTLISDEGLSQLAKMSELEQLRLASQSITDAGLVHVGKLGHLRFLHLIDMPITDEGLDHLHTLTHLESLYLDGTHTSDEGIERLVKALPKVHLHINAHHHRLDPHGAEHSH